MDESFVEMLKSYLSLVERKTEDEAAALVEKHRQLVTDAASPGDVVAIAAEIHRKESEEV